MSCGTKDITRLCVFDVSPFSNEEGTEGESEGINVSEISGAAFGRARAIAEDSASKTGEKSGSLAG